MEHMRDKLRVSGQLWQPEKMLKTTAIYQKIVLSSKMIINKFKQLVSQRERFISDKNIFSFFFTVNDVYLN